MHDIDKYGIHLKKRPNHIDIDIYNDLGFIVFCCVAHFHHSTNQYIIQLSRERGLSDHCNLTSILLHHKIVEIINTNDFIGNDLTMSLAITPKALISIL